MKALLVIDMQRGSFTPATPRFDTEGVVNRINRLSAAFRAQGNKVIYIQHDGTKANDFIPGSDEWKLLPSLEVSPTDILVSKTANDCFYNSILQEILTQHQVSELVITGCATDFCVDTTIKSALSKDYDVTVVKDGHTTADRPHMNAATTIAHYNWVWEHMLPAKNKLNVMTCDELEMR